MHEQAPIPVRPDLRRAHTRAWARLGAPGTWLDGPTRVAVAREARGAGACRLCEARRAALSPNAVAGTHDSPGELAAAHVDVVHRVRNDAPRITAAWAQDAMDRIGDGAYVETVAVAATVLAVDGFHRALGWPAPPLPAPQAGDPGRRRPARARVQLGWVPTLNPGESGPGETDPYRDVSGVHIHQALSLVPEEVVAFFELDAAQYLPDAALRDYGREYRDLTHAQIELLAARVSAINQCVY